MDIKFAMWKIDENDEDHFGAICPLDKIQGAYICKEVYQRLEQEAVKIDTLWGTNTMKGIITMPDGLPYEDVLHESVGMVEYFTYNMTSIGKQIEFSLDFEDLF